MWNDRYAGDEYLFGTAPADFLLRAAPWLTPGESALAIADGEGRNSVFLAERGMEVTAFDSSDAQRGRQGAAPGGGEGHGGGVSPDRP